MLSHLMFLWCGSQQGQNAHNWRPSVIPRNRVPFRDSKTVPSKVWLFGRRERCRNWVHFSESRKEYGKRDLGAATTFFAANVAREC